MGKRSGKELFERNPAKIRTNSSNLRRTSEISQWTFFSAALLLLAASAFGQTRGFLKVSVIDGDGAFNDIKNKIGHPPAVEVRDESNIVVGAEVVFTMPALGPGGAFANGQRSMKATTGRPGIATAESFRPNPTEGRFAIAVAASYMGKQGAAVVGQSNTLATSSPHS